MTPQTLILPLSAGMDWISANQRLHWAPRAELTRYWRSRARITARKAGLPRLERAHIVVTVHKTNRRRYDAHNLYPTGKAIVDGLIDAGLLPDDSNEFLVGPDMREGEKRDVRELVVTITPLEGTDR